MAKRPIMDVGLVILAGGQGKRLGGQNKAQLVLNEQNFFAHLLAATDGLFAEKILSVASKKEAAEAARNYCLPKNWQITADQTPSAGPLAGLYAAFLVSKCQMVLLISCDTPFVERSFVNFLLTCVDDQYQCFVPFTTDGRLHPLCAIYDRSVLPVAREQLEAGDFKMHNFLQKLAKKEISLAASGFGDDIVFNVNTPEDLAKAQQIAAGFKNTANRQKLPIIAVCGSKNSGKTTFLTNLIPYLKRAGLKVLVVKHDAHDFTPDVPDTDSFILREAGADEVAIYSQNHFAVFGHGQNLVLEDALSHLGEGDIILLEGGKNSPYPKIEILRAANNPNPVADPQTLLALCTDVQKPPLRVTVFGLTDYKKVAELILARFKNH